MDDVLIEFFERLVNDIEFRQKFVRAKTAEEAYKLALPYLGDVTFNEFKRALTCIHDQIKHKSRIINKNDMSNISGGIEEFSDEDCDKIIKTFKFLGSI